MDLIATINARVDQGAVTLTTAEWGEIQALIARADTPVAELDIDYHLLKIKWLVPIKYGQFQPGTKLYASPPALDTTLP